MDPLCFLIYCCWTFYILESTPILHFCSCCFFFSSRSQHGRLSLPCLEFCRPRCTCSRSAVHACNILTLSAQHVCKVNLPSGTTLQLRTVPDRSSGKTCIWAMTSWESPSQKASESDFAAMLATLLQQAVGSSAALQADGLLCLWGVRVSISYLPRVVLPSLRLDCVIYF